MEQDSYSQHNTYYYGRSQAPAPSAATSANITPLRPGTPNTDGSRRDPFRDSDGIDVAPTPQRVNSGLNPFASPTASRPASSYGSSSGNGERNEPLQRFFHSRRVAKGEVEKPWVGKAHPKEKWVTIFPLLGILVGLGISGFLIYDGLSSVVHHDYCPVLDDDFGGGLNTNIWSKEVEIGGFGYVVFHAIYLCGNDANSPTETMSFARPLVVTRMSTFRTATSLSRPHFRMRIWSRGTMSSTC